MSEASNKIINSTKMEAIIKRLAYQIYESNASNEAVVIAGIYKNGAILAKQLCKQLQAISSLKVSYVIIRMDKNDPKKSIETNISLSSLENQSVVIVDDVLNTGKTLIYATHHFLNITVRQLQTAVIVNRNHKIYPIKADFKGISLATTLKEHISVEMEGVKAGVYLT